MVGLGGSQKAEVAWLDAQGIMYEELDVSQFSLEYVTGFQGDSSASVFTNNNPMMDKEGASGSNPCATSLDKGTIMQHQSSHARI